MDDNVQLTQDMDISPGDSTPTSEVNYNHSTTTAQNLNIETNATGPVLLATALPRLISHPLHVPSTPNSSQPESSPAQSTPSMVPPPASVTTSNAPGPPVTLNTHLSTAISSSPIDNSNSLQLSRQVSHTDIPVPLSVDTNHMGPLPEGPPTPTHSETPDCAKGTFFLNLTFRSTD